MIDDNRTNGLFEVSQSKVTQWRTCRRKWWYAHAMRLQRRTQARPLAFGSIVHKMKETMVDGQDPLSVLDELPRKDVETFENHPEEYGDIITDIRYIFLAYQEYWRDRELVYLPTKNGRYAEHPFAVEIPKTKILLKGTIDAVTKHRKFNWLTEHKNHKNIPNDDERWRSVQSVVYLRVIEILGWWKNIEGTCWDYIRTKPPTRPQINKDGSISKRAIDTLPNVVRDALKNYKDRAAVKQLIDAATLNMPNYFQRVYTPIKKQLIAQVWDDFISTAKEMRDAPMRPPVRTIGRHCSWCQFEPICRAEFSGGDADFVIEREYVPSTYGVEREETD